MNPGMESALLFMKEKIRREPEMKPAALTKYKFFDVIRTEDMEKLKKIEYDFNIQITALMHGGGLAEVAAFILGMEEYATILQPYDQLPPVGDALLHLTDAMGHSEAWDVREERERMVRLVMTLVFNLIRWRHDVFELGIKNPHVYDDSLLNDTRVVADLFRGRQVAEEDFQVTFFDPALAEKSF